MSSYAIVTASSRYPIPPIDTDARTSPHANSLKMPNHFVAHNLNPDCSRSAVTAPQQSRAAHPFYPYHPHTLSAHPAANGNDQRPSHQAGRSPQQAFPADQYFSVPPASIYQRQQQYWQPMPNWAAGPSHTRYGYAWQQQQQQPQIQPPLSHIASTHAQAQWYANTAPFVQQANSLIQPPIPPGHQPQTQTHLFPAAPAFTAVNAQQHQQLRYAQGGTAVTVDKQKGRKRHKAQEAASGQEVQPAGAKKKKKNKPPKQNGGKLYLLPRPSPAVQYMLQATRNPLELGFERPLLIILDLNGTLLFRKTHGGSNAFIARPHVHEFLDYLFSTHSVMVWSSARPENVAKMCSNLFTKAQQQQLAAMWGRDRLGLSHEMYNQKVQVYKQLSWVWSDPLIQEQGSWRQSNTVLIDDSVEKAASEPYNLIQIDEFDGNATERDEDLLIQLAKYLDTLRGQQDVSAYIRSSPFEYGRNDDEDDDEAEEHDGGISIL